jgi:hypothetical protein
MEDTNFFISMLSNPFTRGLLIGIVITLAIWIRSKMKLREVNGQLKKLREHLHTKLEIDSEENERRKEKLITIQKERDNLRNMIQVLNQKPGRQELRQFQVHQKALDIMFEKAPGFAPTWQITLKEAEEEMKNAEKGIIPFFKRMTSSTAISGGSSDTSYKKQLELQEHNSH